MKIEMKKLREFMIDNIIINYECPICSFTNQQRGEVVNHILLHKDLDLSQVFSD